MSRMAIVAMEHMVLLRLVITSIDPEETSGCHLGMPRGIHIMISRMARWRDGDSITHRMHTVAQW